LGFLILNPGIRSDQIAVGVPTPSNETIPFQLAGEFLIVLKGQIGSRHPISQTYFGRLCESTALTGIRLGAKELQSSVLLLSRASASLPAEIDGYIGTNLLHAQVIELDFASETLRWR